MAVFVGLQDAHESGYEVLADDGPTSSCVVKQNPKYFTLHCADSWF